MSGAHPRPRPDDAHGGCARSSLSGPVMAPLGRRRLASGSLCFACTGGGVGGGVGLLFWWGGRWLKLKLGLGFRAKFRARFSS